MRSLILGLLLSLPAWAALPPLSQAQREQQSQLIVVGTVGKIVSQVEPGKDSGFANRVFRARVHVVTGVKGKPPADDVDITWWKAEKRPSGWAGPGGQNGEIEAGSKVKVYLGSPQGKVYPLLQPNGWDPVK